MLELILKNLELPYSDKEIRNGVTKEVIKQGINKLSESSRKKIAEVYNPLIQEDPENERLRDNVELLGLVANELDSALMDDFIDHMESLGYIAKPKKEEDLSLLRFELEPLLVLKNFKRNDLFKKYIHLLKEGLIYTSNFGHEIKNIDKYIDFIFDPDISRNFKELLDIGAMFLDPEEGYDYMIVNYESMSSIPLRRITAKNQDLFMSRFQESMITLAGKIDKELFLEIIDFYKIFSQSTLESAAEKYYDAVKKELSKKEGEQRYFVCASDHIILHFWPVSFQFQYLENDPDVKEKIKGLMEFFLQPEGLKLINRLPKNTDSIRTLASAYFVSNKDIVINALNAFESFRPEEFLLYSKEEAYFKFLDGLSLAGHLNGIKSMERYIELFNGETLTAITGIIKEYGDNFTYRDSFIKNILPALSLSENPSELIMLLYSVKDLVLRNHLVCTLEIESDWNKGAGYFDTSKSLKDDMKAPMVRFGKAYSELLLELKNEILAYSDPKVSIRLFEFFDLAENLSGRLEWAKILSNKKFNSMYEKLDELIIGSLLLDKDMYEAFEILKDGGVNAVESWMSKRLTEMLSSPISNLERYTEAGFLQSAVKILQHGDKIDPNLVFIMQKASEYGSFRNFLFNDENSIRTISLLRENNYDLDYFVASREEILRRTGNDGAIIKWEDGLKSIVKKILGSRDAPPEAPIPEMNDEGVMRKMNPRGTMKQIKPKYDSAIAGDKSSAFEIIDFFLAKLEKIREKNRLWTPQLEGLHDELNGVIGQIKYGIKTKGGTIIAAMNGKFFPEEFHDNERLSCCVFYPKGENKREAAMIALDPQTPMVLYWIEGYPEFVGAAPLYAGKNNVILLDTWEANDMIYSVLGREKTMEFSLDSLVLATNSSLIKPNKFLFIYEIDYGKPLAFLNYVKEQSKELSSINYIKDFDFEAIDLNDSALRNSRTEIKHHFTSAFCNPRDTVHQNPLKGRISGYIISVESYIKERGLEHAS